MAKEEEKDEEDVELVPLHNSRSVSTTMPVRTFSTTFGYTNGETRFVTRSSNWRQGSLLVYHLC